MELLIVEPADKPTYYVLLDVQMQLMKEVNNCLCCLRICGKFSR